MNQAEALDRIMAFIFDEVHNAAIDSAYTDETCESSMIISLGEMIEHGSLREQLANWTYARERSHNDH